MSKITHYWKRMLRPPLLNAMRALRGAPVPKLAVGTRHYVESQATASLPRCELLPMPSPQPNRLPAHDVSGDLLAIEHVLSRITNRESRAAYERNLRGIVQRDIADDFVAIIPGGQVTHDAGVVITPDNRLLADVSGLGFSSPEPTNPLRLNYLPRRKSVRGCVAVLACDLSGNFYHWTIGTLPRLEFYERAGVEIDYFYVPAWKRYQRESLRLLGVPPGKIIPARRNQHLVADQLLVSSWNAGITDRRKCDFLHQRMTRGIVQSRERPLRVFISRRHGKRIIINEEQLFRSLKPLGFQRFYLERMTLAAQVALFQRAECVIGGHGAGLTNLLFCQPGAKVLEIGTPYRPFTCFYEIAAARELTYHLFMATPVNVSHFDPEAGTGDSDMQVPTSAFLAVVEKLLATNSLLAKRAA